MLVDEQVCKTGTVLLLENLKQISYNRKPKEVWRIEPNLPFSLVNSALSCTFSKVFRRRNFQFCSSITIPEPINPATYLHQWYKLWFCLYHVLFWVWLSWCGRKTRRKERRDMYMISYLQPNTFMFQII